MFVIVPAVRNQVGHLGHHCGYCFATTSYGSGFGLEVDGACTNTLERCISVPRLSAHTEHRFRPRSGRDTARYNEVRGLWQSAEFIGLPLGSAGQSTGPRAGIIIPHFWPDC